MAARKSLLFRIYYSFPMQLFVLLLKKNHLLLIYWLFIWSCITNNFATKYGVPYLFLDPEYTGHVGFWSFYIMGFSAGGFIMAFNISSYVLNGFRFPFLATLSRPFLKYFVNNSFLPIAFIVIYLWQVISFQLFHEFQAREDVIAEVLAFLLGIASISFVTLTYFFTTNKDIGRMYGLGYETGEVKSIAEEISIAAREKKWAAIRRAARKGKEWPVDNYLSIPFRIRLVRSTDHYDKELLMSVFKQNHLNAAIIEVIVFATIILLGFFRDVPLFRIPAGACILLIFSMLLMITSALRFWLRGWASFLLIAGIVVINYFSQFEVFTQRNHAYGMDYKTVPAPYFLDTLKALGGYVNYENDVLHTISILDKWKKKASSISLYQGNMVWENANKKPKMIFICTSGGGIRAALWSMRTLQVTDSILKGKLFDYTSLVTGSSGGAIGASYFRELYLENKSGKKINYRNDSYLANISKDVLNPIAVSIAVNDLFAGFQNVKIGNYRYKKDRAYEFERQLNENTGYVLDKRLIDYRQPELDAVIPMTIFNPTIINDGRRLFISAQPVSYLINRAPSDNFVLSPIIEGVEFTRFFEKQNAWNTRFTSVLRMNATFPYVMPTVTLPSEPPVEVMDAGMRDNFGLQASLRFIYTFRKWITSNTSGIVMIQIRDTHKEIPIDKKNNSTMFQNITSPVGNFYANFAKVQDYNQDELLQYASSWFDGKIDFLIFELPNDRQKISLSWHLTTREKQYIYDAINLPENQQSLYRLRQLVSD